MTYINKIKNFIKTRYIISIIILVVLGGILFMVFSNGNGKTEPAKVSRGEVVQKVIVNGKTKAVNSVDLAFEVNGTVRSTFVDIGSRVAVGQALVALEQSSLQADLLKAKANVLSEQARLDELKKGTRPEEISIAETELKNAENSYNIALQNMVDKSIDAINNNIDQLFSNPQTSNPKFNLTINDTQLKSDIESGRVEIEGVLARLSPNPTDVDINKISLFIDNVARAVNSQSANASLSQTVLDGYKSDVSSARSSIITAKDNLNSSRSALLLAQKNLVLKKSGSTPEAIASQEAKVMQNEAQVKSVESQISKMTLRSPQGGIVTAQNAKVGEIVTPGKVIVSIISDNNLEIEANVSEVSVGKVSVGNKVEISFDAFPGEVFSGTVTYIEPGETLVDGVVNYKVKIAFSEKYPQIKNGLTSKLDIITNIKTDVLTIPQYGLITEDGETFVMKQVGKEFVKTAVTVGLKGQNGLVEVVSGISEGDMIDVSMTQ